VTVGFSGVVGHAPTVKIEPYNPEQKKYEKLWDEVPNYRVISPGEKEAMQFLAQAKPKPGATCIDFGAGTGRGSLMLASIGEMEVTMLDFAANCLDPDIAKACGHGKVTFLQHDLTKPSPVQAQYGYCCDVMEHIPEQDVRAVLSHILSAAKLVYFSISTVPDVMGPSIGEDLHLTVKPAAWWAKQLTKAGAIIFWQDEQSQHVSFYCSSWKDPKDSLIGTTNVSKEVMDAQVRANILDGWQQVSPHQKQDREVVFLCGGPSMNDWVEGIKALRAEGAALVTCNGAYQWALDHGMEPSAQIVIDAREFNARFTKPVTPYTKYLIASQCHPKTYEGLPHDRTYQWHSGISEENEALVRALNDGHFFPIPGGSTVVLRAIPLLRLLGFAKLHLFGFDSCVRADAHHAYAQPENDKDVTTTIDCGGKLFTCTAWQAVQASEFRDIVKLLGDEMEMAVYGDGLIAQMISTAAKEN